MEISNLSDTEFKTRVIRMLKELIGHFNNIKKNQAEMTVTLSEIKIYRESTIQWKKPRIKSLIWNVRKKKNNQNSKKKKRIQ